MVAPVNGNVADAVTLATAGVQKWSLANGAWHLVYVLQDGLNIGLRYSARNYPAAINPATTAAATSLAASTATAPSPVYAVTSTISASGDQGADPNRAS